MLTRTSQAALLIGLILTSSLFASGCGDDDRGPVKPNEVPTSGGKSGKGDDDPEIDEEERVEPSDTCTPLRSEEATRARTVVYDDDAKSFLAGFVATSDVFNQFKTYCGGCHVDTNRGGFQVPGQGAFVEATAAYQQKILDHMRSDLPGYYMPPAEAPNSKPWSERDPDDPVVELAGRLESWFAQGSPQDLFFVDEAKDDERSDRYLLPKEIAKNLTNMGHCYPAKQIVGAEQEEMDELDDAFADMTELPATLDETDLVTFDAEKLARRGVFSFVPAYPLWSEGAHKMRHVRVPRGESIEFDKKKQEFKIPPNTRFYKTFFKPVVERAGGTRYRKLETRLIVSKPDGPRAGDGTYTPTALFGTYAWDADERKATLVKDPLRNGAPFRDRLVTIITDEIAAEQTLGADPPPIDRLAALREAGASRTYAIPGSERCIQCHMGSASKNFVLGFLPLQIMRRPAGEGGVIDSASDDELEQLDRLIEYGVITGLSGADDIVPLEESQGDRKPRNEHELRAQSYMLGNCSHCHNPRGFPTEQNPVLRDLLDFLPSEDGGIFQFPLDRVSPRIKRGEAQDRDIPYITPSLVDYAFENGAPPLYVLAQTDPAAEASAGTSGGHGPQHGGGSGGKSGGAAGAPSEPIKTLYYMAAPWRSLLYRNVDSPFPFAYDAGLFPHMPLNVAGFDCRAPGIMGDWMVSIPARRRGSTSASEVLDAPGPSDVTNPIGQLYEEVKPGDSHYLEALSVATQRLGLYHNGGPMPPEERPGSEVDEYRYSNARYAAYCPDTSDIVLPPAVGSQPGAEGADDAGGLPSRQRALERGKLESGKDPVSDSLGPKADQVPDRPNWVVTDITDAPGEWFPRRTDWKTVLVDRSTEGVGADQQQVISLLQTVAVSQETRDMALTPVPFGLWQKKDTCDFSQVPKVSDFAAARPRWMTMRALPPFNKPEPAPTDPVYMQSPGAAVFNTICVNCHGPRFDSRGRRAETLLLMTGGQTRVANFRDGLFGPVEMPGANRTRVFAEAAMATPAPDDTADDWGARYMAWMALGGTQRVIPTAILNVISTAKLLGEDREPSGSISASANMLSMARGLCSQVIGRLTNQASFDMVRGKPRQGADATTDGGIPTSLIESNGDAELWLRLCTFQNPAPVLVAAPLPPPFADGWQDPLPHIFVDDSNGGWFRRDQYPATDPIGNGDGEAQVGVPMTNVVPWCTPAPASPEEQAGADAFIASSRGGRPLPYCPAGWKVEANRMTPEELDRWALRGAINAGLAVFLYLDKLSHDALMGRTPQPDYNACELLSPNNATGR
jgi:mono/diheme cytochrome c family protein